MCFEILLPSFGTIFSQKHDSRTRCCDAGSSCAELFPIILIQTNNSLERGLMKFVSCCHPLPSMNQQLLLIEVTLSLHVCGTFPKVLFGCAPQTRQVECNQLLHVVMISSNFNAALRLLTALSNIYSQRTPIERKHPPASCRLHAASSSHNFRHYQLC